MPDFRRIVLDLLDADRKVIEIAAVLDVSEQTVYIFRKQHLIERGRTPWITSNDLGELVAARNRFTRLKAELDVTRRAKLAGV